MVNSETALVALCPGCDLVLPSTCDCTSHENWSISCGCDSHGDHLGCSKTCASYGCAHPLGLALAGSLAESETYSSKAPPYYLIERAVADERKRARRKLDKKMRKLDKILAKWS